MAGEINDDAVLGELDELAERLLGEGRLLRTGRSRDEWAQLDLRGHPWARLLAASAWLNDPKGRQHALAALRAFRRRGERRGEGYACLVIGRAAIERGDIARATRWWNRALEVAGATAPGFEPILAHVGLEAYAAGRLTEALAVTEQAIAVSRLRRTPQAEAIALVNAAFFRLWTGEFDRALTVLDAAEAAFGEVPDPLDRYELPLCFGARAVAHSLRGEAEQAECEFERALNAAARVRAVRYEAFVRAVRAELTASVDLLRARRDADTALALLQQHDDRWWYPWAAQAAGVVAAETGAPDAAEHLLGLVLEQTTLPLEQARTRLLLGEIRIQAGHGERAVPVLEQAAAVFERSGAAYWADRCYVRLASADPAHSRGWMMRMRNLATDESARRQLLGDGGLRLAAYGPGYILSGDRPLAFRSQAAERALFLLALAAPGGLSVEQLAEHLWPDARIERRRLLGRIRTLLWDAREGLGAHAWRLARVGSVVHLDMTGAQFDLEQIRAQARRALSTASQQAPGDLVDRLRRPLLSRWIYEDWVIELALDNEHLAEELAHRNIRTAIPSHAPARTGRRSPSVAHGPGTLVP